MSYKFFTISFDQVPPSLPTTCTVWYSMWTTVRPSDLPPNARPPMVVGVTAEDKLPAGATLLDGDKDPLPPPPPDLAVTSPEYEAAYLRSFKTWLAHNSLSRGGVDE